MGHERDREHPTELPPRETAPDSSKPCPDRKKSEHPNAIPREPVDPKLHPGRVIARAA
jgi:hypothetical protein